MRVRDHNSGFKLMPFLLLPIEAVGLRKRNSLPSLRSVFFTNVVEELYGQGSQMSDDGKVSLAIEAVLMQRLDSASVDGLRIGQLNIPASGTAEGRKYRQVLKHLCSEKKIINLGTPKRPIYLNHKDFRPIERVSNSLLAFASASGCKLFTLSQFRKVVSPSLRQYCADAIMELTRQGSLIEFRWSAHKLYCHSDVVAQEDRQIHTSRVPPVVKHAYDVVVQDRGYPDVLIHDIHKQVCEVDVGDLVDHLQDACARGEAIPSEGDWSLSTEEERKFALTIGGDPYLRIRLLEAC